VTTQTVQTALFPASLFSGSEPTAGRLHYRCDATRQDRAAKEKGYLVRWTRTTDETPLRNSHSTVEVGVIGTPLKLQLLMIGTATCEITKSFPGSLALSSSLGLGKHKKMEGSKLQNNQAATEQHAVRDMGA